MTVVALVLSWGPELKLGRLPLGVPLPAALLRAVVPFADGLRSWGQFSALVTLGVSLAAAGLCALLRNRPARVQHMLTLAALAVALFAAWTGWVNLVEVAPRPVDVWLAEQPGRDPLMQFPVEAALSGPSILYTRYHGKPVVFGYGTYYPFRFREEHPALLTFPADAALNQLADWGVRWVLVALDYDAPYTLGEVDAQPRLRRTLVLGDQAVYELAG